MIPIISSPSPEVVAAIIGVISALSVVITQDLLARLIHARRADKRSLVAMRLERAYVPLQVLAFQLMRSTSVAERLPILADIQAVLRKYGHLLTASSLEAFYTCWDDIETGAWMLQQSFDREQAALTRTFYQLWYSRQELTIPVGAKEDQDAKSAARLAPGEAGAL